MEIKIQSTRFIKPSKPTPENLRYFKLSGLDQLAPSAYFNIIFYYIISGAVNISDRCGQLVESLSEVLNLYYPLAGRLTLDNLQVDCSDQGVKYRETEVSTRLDSFLSQGPNIDLVGQLICAPELVPNTLVTVQVNVFECGSLVISVSASHKVTDAYNLVRFVNEWASTNRAGSSNGPSFDNLPSLFPLMKNIQSLELAPATFDQVPLIRTKRYVFNGTAISNLRAKASSENSKHSRVTLVSSVIWKALISVDQVKSGRFRDYLLSTAMNLRGKIGSPVSESSFGNVWIPYRIWFLQTGTESKFADVVALIEDTTRNIINWLPKASGEETCTQAMACYSEVSGEVKQNINKVCLTTSWCGFPIYEADFGWGKPYWASTLCPSIEMVVLMDDKYGDGIEAWVSLNEKDMYLFEQDHDVIALTS